MEARLFAEIISDKKFCDFQKMQHKYSKTVISEVLELLKDTMYVYLPIMDFHGKQIVYLKNIVQLDMSALKLLLAPQNGYFGIKAMEEEIHSSLAIENIASSRSSIRRILDGYAPADEGERKIYGIKKGLEFISDRRNAINEENLFRLYDMSVGGFLQDREKLLSGSYYRHDDVFVVGDKIKHQGLTHSKLSEYMKKFIEFINAKDDINDLLKAAIIHFYLGYIHPYFDGNGRTARLLHLWSLVRQGYPSALFIPFSSYINETRQKYYSAFSLTEGNTAVSELIDVTPFLLYFAQNVYNKLAIKMKKPGGGVIESFQKLLLAGEITEKERDLWNFALSVYGDNEFSTKQLERDFKNAAYATIRGFVIKFSSHGLLEGQRYSNKMKYRIVF